MSKLGHSNSSSKSSSSTEYLNLWESTSGITKVDGVDGQGSVGSTGSKGSTTSGGVGKLRHLQSAGTENASKQSTIDESDPLYILRRERNLIQMDLINIQTLIRLTKGNLESLNEQFADQKYPPPDYLIEYEDLTTKLNDFQTQENTLLDQLDEIELKLDNYIIDSSVSPTSTTCPEVGSLNSCPETAGLDPDRMVGTSSASFGTSSSLYDASSVPFGTTSVTDGSNPLMNDDVDGQAVDTIPIHGSSSGLLRVQLPNQQRTTVPARVGLTLREALFKAMRRRKLRHETCLIFKLVTSSSSSYNNNHLLSPPPVSSGHGRSSPTQTAESPSKVLLDWNSESVAFSGQELLVECLEKVPITTSISHNFIRKTFFTLAFCEVCTKILFHGFKCDVCAFKFHQKCSGSVPSLCQPHLSPGGPNSGAGSGSGYLHRPPSPSSYGAVAAGTTLGQLYDPDYEPVTRNSQYWQHLLGMDSNNPVNIRSMEATVSISTARSSGVTRIGTRTTPSLLPLDLDHISAISGPGSNKSSNKGKASIEISEEGTDASGRERSTSAPNVHMINPRNLSNLAPPPTAPHKSGHFFFWDLGRKNTKLSTKVSDQKSGGKSSGASSSGYSSKGSSVSGSRGNNLANAIPVSSGTEVKGHDLASHSSKSRPRARSADESSAHRIGQKQKVDKRESTGIEDWEIPEEDIIWGPRIGSGSFGTVYKGSWHGPVALKRLHVAGLINSSGIGARTGPEAEVNKPTAAQLQAFKNEVAVLRKTRHVNILLFMGCVHQQLTIVTQWCEGSSLYKHIHILETRFDVRDVIDICRQTAQGMDYLQ